MNLKQLAQYGANAEHSNASLMMVAVGGLGNFNKRLTIAQNTEQNLSASQVLTVKSQGDSDEEQSKQDGCAEEQRQREVDSEAVE